MVVVQGENQMRDPMRHPEAMLSLVKGMMHMIAYGLHRNDSADTSHTILMTDAT